MVERCDPFMQVEEISLEEWHKQVETELGRDMDRALYWAAWGFRFQGFSVGAAATVLLWWLLP